jgi:MFS family permease
MYKTLKNNWALFIGFAILATAHGFQGNLLGVRAVIEEFNYLAVGALFSGYFLGYFVGAFYCPKLINSVGHIRTFSAFASLASLSALVHVTFVNPYVWIFGRFLTGFSMIAIFIVTESWLNDRATNRNRGQILSLYMIITYVAFATGNLLLNVSSPTKYEPFILISVLFSIALVPILLAKKKPPKFKKTASMNIKELYRISPFGSFAMLCTGFIYSAVLTLASVYAANMNLTIYEISILLTLIVAAGAIFQWPIGYISDRMDRRKVIITSGIFAIIFCMLAILFSGTSFSNAFTQNLTKFNYFSTTLEKTKLFLSITLMAGMTLTFFPIILAYVNDNITKDKFVAAGSGLNIVFGVGAIFGPILCSVTMQLLGANGFFVYIILFLTLMVIFGVYRITRSEYEENPDSSFTPLPKDITPLGIELDPDTGADLSSQENKS